MASKKCVSCIPANTHLLGERYAREGGLPEGPPVETERWPKYGVSYSPYCGVLGEGLHYVGAKEFL